jgi:hypothetical protein
LNGREHSRIGKGGKQGNLIIRAEVRHWAATSAAARTTRRSTSGTGTRTTRTTATRSHRRRRATGRRTTSGRLGLQGGNGGQQTGSHD